MKYNKKVISGILAATLCAGSVAFAAPSMTKNLGINYNVKLKVNGEDYSISDSSQRPFKTSDGRAYISIASLTGMGIATSTFADNTVIIKGTGGSGLSSSDLQSQVSALSATNNNLLTTNNNLQTENAKLKAEIETLKKTSSSSSNSSSSSSKPFNDLSSSDKRDLVKDIESDLKGLRADSDFQRSQRFEVSASIDKDSVSLQLTPYENWTADEIKSWNALMDKSSDYDDLVEAFEDFVDETYDEVSSTLKDYKGYDVNVNIYSDTKADNLVVDGEYRNSKDKVYADLSKAK